ncbi:SgcJ/EcaC family oxidoreductase [Isosphaeraceae bacterium EP7]
MRLRPCPAIACVLLLHAATCTPLHAQAPADDDAAIRVVVQKYVDSREAKDPKAIEALLTEDADQLVSDGTWRKGRDVLVKGMLASSAKNPARRTIDVETVRHLSPDIALVDGRYRQLGGEGAGKTREMWTAITLKRGPDGWRIAAIRNMLPALN